MKRFSLSESPIDIGALNQTLRANEAGAFTSFEGWVRNHNDGRAVDGLRYEAYVALAENEGEKILQEAMQRFACIDAHCVHRIGELAIGDCAVWVGVSAAHRDAAFAACRWIIDEVKSRVAIWKHEHYEDGDKQWLHPLQSPPPLAGEG
jgi:molybdopterin synthase catalytic subunit